jgi:hypothetical protein
MNVPEMARRCEGDLDTIGEIDGEHHTGSHRRRECKTPIATAGIEHDPPAQV